MTITPVGTHCILELYGCPFDLLNDVDYVRDAIEQSSHQGMSTLLELSSHRFQPHGVTAVGLLAESHVSVHTWPEHGYAAIDVFTCGETARPEQACDYLIDRFSAREHTLKVLSRGGPAEQSAFVFDCTPVEEANLCPAPN